jgi:hypothetical protein
MRLSYLCICCFMLSFLLIMGTSVSFAAQNVRVGFIEGRGTDADVQAQAFTNAGVQYQVIGKDNYKIEQLLKFDVIAVGVVAYDQNEDLKANFKVVNEYIARGGYVVTLDFQQDSMWGKGFFPNTISLFDDDLDDAKIKLIDHPVWNNPHKITEENFLGWGAGDFMADGPHEANPPWKALLVANDWPIVQGLQAGSGYVIFSALQTLQSLGRNMNEKVAEVMRNLLFWRGPLAVNVAGKLMIKWGSIKVQYLMRY